MIQTQEKSSRDRILETVADFIQRNRVLLWSLLGAVAAVFVVVAVWTQIQQSVNARSTRLVEQAEDTFVAWQTEEDEETRAEIAGTLTEQLGDIIDAHARRYAGMRALFIRGSFYYQTEQWQSAVGDFREVADRFADTYLASVSLMNAAAAAEQMGRPATASELYDRVAAEYAGSSPEVPHALFSSGRILEETGSAERAAERYNQLIDEYPASSWTKLARDRIIALTVRGDIAE